jgi:hypothetical protein
MPASQQDPDYGPGNVIIRYWPGSENVPTGAVVAIVLALYAAINLVSVKWYVFYTIDPRYRTDAREVW